MPRRYWAVYRRIFSIFIDMDEPESVTSGRFFLRLNELLAMYGLSDEEYLRFVLPGINESNIFNADVAERAIRRYRKQKTNGG